MLKDACHAHIMFEIIHTFINVHDAVSLSSFLIPIYGTFVETILKCHGTSSNTPTSNGIHQPCIVSNEWGQRWNSFNLWLYVWNLTWLDKTHAFIVWEGFKSQGCMLCPHSIWDCPHFHQRSSCSLTVIIHHSHQGNLCWNYLEMPWNVF